MRINGIKNFNYIPFRLICRLINTAISKPCTMHSPLKINELNETKKAVNSISSIKIISVTASEICCDFGIVC